MCKAAGAAIVFLLGGVLTGHCAAEQHGRLSLVGTNTVSLGTFPNTEERAARVQIRNSGEGTLKVERVVATCRCLRVDAYPRLLAPGETGDVVVAIVKNEVAGAFERVFFIESDDPSNRSVKVRVEGFAKPLFLVTCDAATWLGPVDVGQVWTGRYTVAATEAGFMLGSPSKENRGARCDYAIRTNRQEKVSYEVTLSVTFEGDGFLESALVFPVLRKAGEPPLPVRLVVQAVRKRYITAEPDHIQAPQTPVPFKRRLLLSVDFPTPLEADNLRWKTDLQGIEVLPQVTQNGKGFLVTLVFPAGIHSTLARLENAEIVFQYGDRSVGVPVLSGK
jgi:hypothetical protein